MARVFQSDSPLPGFRVWKREGGQWLELFGSEGPGCSLGGQEQPRIRPWLVPGGALGLGEGQAASAPSGLS